MSPRNLYMRGDITMAKSPRIRIELSLDGAILDATVLADTVADRDAALRRLQLIVPMLSVFEQDPTTNPRLGGGSK